LGQSLAHFQNEAVETAGQAVDHPPIHRLGQDFFEPGLGPHHAQEGPGPFQAQDALVGKVGSRPVPGFGPVDGKGLEKPRRRRKMKIKVRGRRQGLDLSPGIKRAFGFETVHLVLLGVVKKMNSGF